MQKWVIKDWTGRLMKFDGRPFVFDSFDDAEEVLSEELAENYETDRQEYQVEEIQWN